MGKLRIFWLVFFVTVLCVSAKRPFELPWYKVDPWEVEVCSKWGGRVAPADVVFETGITPFGDMTMTVQGRRVTAFGGQFLYEIAYYLESFAATTSYQIDMLNPKTQQVHSVTAGTLGPGSAVADVYAEYLNESFTRVRITHDRGVIVVPIVEVR